jgi:tetraacyldisaccharide 4'-kinase
MNLFAFVLLLPVSFSFWLVTQVRNALFDLGWLKVNKIEALRIVSVGNLSVGGTGKTPFVILLVDYLRDKGQRVAVLNRGYRSESSDVRQVVLESSAEKSYGDEPVMIKKRYPDIPVYVGTDKSRACKMIADKESVDWIIVDDGFQHRWLARDVDIVLFDSMTECWQSWLLPSGRFRESIGSLRRASQVVLTKANLAEKDRLKKWKAKLEKYSPLIVHTVIEKIVDVATGQTVEIEALKNKNALVLTAVAKPEAVYKTISEYLQVELVRTMEFADHHLFIQEDWQRIVQEMEKSSVDCVIMTEKDAVKLESWAQTPETYYKVTVKSEIVEGATDAFDSLFVDGVS